jgi:hypothetical protein
MNLPSKKTPPLLKKSLKAMMNMAEKMTHSDYFRIIGIDLSFKDTGVCLLREDRNPASIHLDAFSIKSGCDIGNNFSDYENAAKANHTKLIRLHNTIVNNLDSIVIIEVPAYSQSAKASVSIGMCWSVASFLHHNYPDRVVIIDPGILKYWSESKRGDQKNKVKEKVLGRTSLTPKMASNDNIVDAVGIALAMSDLIKTIERN